MPKDAKTPPTLTEQQKEYVKANWQMDLRTLAQNTFSNPTLTLRHVESKAIKLYLVELGLSGEISTELKTDFELAADDQQYITNNHRASNPLEITRTIFADQTLSLSSPQGKAVLAYCKKIAPELYNRNDEPVEEFEYRAPRNLRELINRVNKLVPNPAGIGTPLYDHEHLNAQHKKNLNVLLSSITTPRFIHQASQYLKKVDRELFESSFMRQIHDLTDLGAADIDQYISYCSSIVSSAQTERTLQRLQGQADTEFEEKGRTSESLIEHIKTLNASVQNEKKRQEALYKTLNGTRSARMNDLTQASVSMHPLVMAWRDKQKRDRLIKLAGQKRDEAGQVIKELSEMDAAIAEIWGLDKDTILK